MNLTEEAGISVGGGKSEDTAETVSVDLKDSTMETDEKTENSGEEQPENDSTVPDSNSNGIKHVIEDDTTDEVPTKKMKVDEDVVSVP